METRGKIMNNLLVLVLTQTLSLGKPSGYKRQLLRHPIRPSHVNTLINSHL